jgi:hypothetical protein
MIREGCADYTSLTQGAILAPGRFWKAVKPLMLMHGWEEVRMAWRHFVKVTELRYATPEHFARTYSDWVLKPKASQAPMTQFREVRDGKRLRLVAE